MLRLSFRLNILGNEGPLKFRLQLGRSICRLNFYERIFKIRHPAFRLRIFQRLLHAKFAQAFAAHCAHRRRIETNVLSVV
jgi:hypothetical protein